MEGANFVMNLEKYNYLQMLCEEQNVSRAAKRLFITQPTLTVFINTLERELGFKIFDRTHTPVLLTASGKRYMEEMRQILLAERRLIDDIRENERGGSSITIGVGQTHSVKWCPGLLEDLLLWDPGLNVVIKEAQETKLMEYLRNDEVDVVLGHVEIDNVNFCFDVFQEESIVIAIPDNLIPKDALSTEEWQEISSGTETEPYEIRPELLTELPLIQPAESQGLFFNLKQLMEIAPIRPSRIMQSSNVITAASLVERGLGYMYVTPYVFHLTQTAVTEKKHLYYCTLPKLPRSRKNYIGYKKDTPHLDVIHRIREILTNTS